MSQSNKNREIIFLIIFILICISITAIAIYFTNKTKGGLQENNYNNVDSATNVATEEKQKIKPDGLGIKSLDATYKMNALKITKETYHSEEKMDGKFSYYPIEVNYVKISGLKNTSIQDKINNEIREVALSQVDENELNVNDVRNITVEARCCANFSNVLSISIYKSIYYWNIESDMQENFICGLNYNLKTGDKLKFTDLFTNDAGTKSIISKSAYMTFANEYLEYFANLETQSLTEGNENTAIWDGDMNKIDYSNIEDRTFKILQNYDRNNEYPFYFTESYIYACINNEEVMINMRDFYNQIAIYDRYADSERLFESQNQNHFLVFSRDTTHVLPYIYVNVQKIADNLFVDLELNYYGEEERLDYENNPKILEAIQSLESMVEECKEYLKQNSDKAIVLNVNKEYDDESNTITDVWTLKAVMSKDYFNDTYLDRVVEYEQIGSGRPSAEIQKLNELLTKDSENNKNISLDAQYAE